MPSDLPALNIDTDASELSDASESPTSPLMMPFNESTATLPGTGYARTRSLSVASLAALPPAAASWTVGRPQRKHSYSSASASAWALADQLSRCCSLVEADEPPTVAAESIVYQRRASAHMIDAYSRRRHRPYAAPIRMTAVSPSSSSSVPSSGEGASADEACTATASHALPPSYYAYKMGKSSLYTLNGGSGGHAPAHCSPVAAAAIVYLSRRGRRNAIGSASHELILTRRVCRQMPA
ncbi:hypothetical protein SYNPS1DRAFT_30402 [Syncephalis pseudoplumigaleata]|uniref:Uncharacterized protein n=1 Tax=Syncephalis pseudoplumigaleata TaxID=1712513 RepID=A0A4P9YV17_9FUNG|nr:hypothetical protein SYNPS1DRAFT_30402 [Syncephalis pseudoplumigaleata]|eukprot:RKP23837.1 hypothetical protein SYNPS1DRAFT_30402 [Syncephalis pseudoplumigaleata]